ncbi:GntR family transcriptional regulator / MocR family aminotransferase [Acetitomaculum ruminis DSM 5522]|uniref:GntR family transcriptional regulator / MocR family aminotransferase n=1 Tax=Acetitomaculum ruminis DSM 5522 TaxID=1120918 RepID=A0A1I1AD11_9FIRM|nr:PLP-dependent aminotransferase family protein [Acetitomaculum ruminis]SFB35236.1 GntR family transcriptional regulator / MocR family aminotransferase [Acetitomaculum ruminis DSM 5522]
MITYNFDDAKEPLYVFLYKSIKKDILSGKLKPGEKLPSKRTFARNNGISTITIQNAYDQLISEGYVYTLQKKGYYVAKIEKMINVTMDSKVNYDIKIPNQRDYKYDFSSNSINPDNFPFSIWNRISREVMSNKKEELMEISPTAGILELREAIALHMKSFRGMLVDPNQIIIGSGTEYFYGLIVQLLGRDKIYVIENPGYKKLEKVYEKQDIVCKYASMDDKGVTALELEKSEASIAHICPNHHYPTGISMPASRRYEVLSWVNAKEGRYIIEDDYDSEFRVSGKPIPPLFSIDGCEKVIYMNTFSKSLAPTIRISYMILPVHLANLFYKNMSFYSCTVSNFEQYTLAKFISEGYLEKHINRMRLYYTKQRKKFMDIINESEVGEKCKILENDSGLHFVVNVDTDKSDKFIEKKLRDIGIKVKALSDYYFTNTPKQHCFIINYSNLDENNFRSAFKEIEKINWK